MTVLFLRPFLCTRILQMKRVGGEHEIGISRTMRVCPARNKSTRTFIETPEKPPRTSTRVVEKQKPIGEVTPAPPLPPTRPCIAKFEGARRQTQEKS